MRKLMWFTLGFGAVCGLCVYFPGMDALLLPAAFSFFTFLCAALLGKIWKRAKVAALVLLGCCCGFLWFEIYDSQYLTHVRVLDGVTQETSMITSDYSYETGYGRAADAAILIEGKSYQIRAYLEEGEELPPGTKLQGSFRFRLTAPDSQQGSTYHAGEGVFLLAYQKGELTFSDNTEDTFSMKASRLRRQITLLLKEYLPEDVYPFAKALLLGDTTDLGYEVDTHLKVSGIRHVVAVSGLHVSILFALLSNLTFRKRYLTALVGLPMLAVFAALAGFTPSVVRACLMSGLMLLGMLLNREYDGGTALSFSALIMLLCNPMSIASVSFQLSVASVAGIFLFSGGISVWLIGKLGEAKGKSIRARLKRWFISSVATSLSAMSLTVPLSAWYFGTVSLISVVTNLLTLWVISFIFYGLMGICALHFLIPSCSLFLGTLTAWLIRYVLITAKMLASFPLACIYTASEYVIFWLIFVYALLAVYLLSIKKQPGILACCASITLCITLLCAWTEPILYDTVITVLDVGQGQCILLQSEGKTYMVDCGGDDDAITADTAAQTLLSRGISRLDGLILTHLDRDHAGAAENLLSRVRTDLVILPPVYNTMNFGSGEVVYADRELDITWGSSKLRVYGEKITESQNENSLCVLLDTEKCDILITGDRDAEGETRLLRAGNIPEVDVFLAGHHGSKFASSEELLAQIQPQIACISVGADNIYGHPAPETLDRLLSFGCEVYRTDVHGTITIRR